MVKPELGTKRIDPETGKKFYDLNRDPIVSPYTGISYPLSYFESSIDMKEDEEIDTEELDTVLEKPDFISLEDAESGAKSGEDLPELEDEEVTLENEEDAFLDGDEDDVSEFIPTTPDDEEEIL